MEVQPLDGDLPSESIVAASMLDLDWEVAALVKSTEFGIGRVRSLHKGGKVHLLVLRVHVLVRELGRGLVLLRGAESASSSGVP